jgi:predicted SnoaL-like aldol condensation-catalyzing enzyme
MAMRKTKLSRLTAFFAIAFSLVYHQTTCQIKTNQKMNNIEKASAINNAVMSTDFNAITGLVAEDYIQHTPMVADGRKGLTELLSKIEGKKIPAPVIKNVRAFEDGEFVVLHHDVNWPTRKAMFEIFRFDNGLAAEHWSGIADHPEKTANGNTMVDGETTVKDKSKTKENKALVQSFVETVLIAGKFDRISEYYHQDIRQHNPYIDNSIPGLIKGIEAFQKQGILLQIEKIHKVFGEGNFVLVLSEGKFGGKPTAFFDLFRVENGKVVEHWDVLQEIPAAQAHTNGMF